MPALILMVILSLSNSWAADPVSFSMFTKGKYAQKMVKIYLDKGQLKCDTENQPPFNLTSDPLAGFVLPSQNKVKSQNDCRDHVIITHKHKVLKGCSEDAVIDSIAKKIDSVCRY